MTRAKSGIIMNCGRAWLICGLLGSSFVRAQQAPADRQEDASDFAEEEAPASFAAKLLDCDRPAPNWAEVLNARIKAGEPMPAWPGAKVRPSDDADPATGALEPVAGEFWFPRYDLQFRPLQAASTDSQVWVAERSDPKSA